MIANCEHWNPPLSGDMDLCIKANGEWYHEGSLMTRQSLVRLFSSILRREQEDYFLVSPVEKWRIKVEDVPFLVVDAQVEAQGITSAQKIQLKTITDDSFFLDAEHPLVLRQKNQELPRPYVRVRQGMDALVHRNIFYFLSSIAVSQGEQMGVWSDGIFFPLE